jgi:hypothetical protein
MAKKKANKKFHLKFGSSFAVFIIFFGISLYEALLNQDMVGAGFWIIVGAVFLVADSITDST